MKFLFFISEHMLKRLIITIIPYSNSPSANRIQSAETETLMSYKKKSKCESAKIEDEIMSRSDDTTVLEGR